MRCEYKHCVPCSLLKLHQLHLIMFGHLYHMIDVPMNSVGGLIEDYKSAVASVVCVVAPVCDPLANKCPLVLAEPVVALLRLRVDRDLPSIWPLPIAPV